MTHGSNIINFGNIEKRYCINPRKTVIIACDELLLDLPEGADRKGVRMDKRKKTLRLILSIAAAAAALAITAVSAYMLWEKAPETETKPDVLANKVLHTPSAETVPPTPDEERGTAFGTGRQDGVYTILFVGNDDGTGNTDTIMVGKLDTVRHTADFVSIPRDTLINVDTPVRKINSVYWGAVNNGGSGIEALRRHVAKLTGFDVDCYAVIDLDAFIETVDAMGGIWFDVPERMYYDGGPVIDLQPGYQLLNGEQAMWLCRYRSTYINGDIDRIDVQHRFLSAAAEQLLDLGSVPNIREVVRILADKTDTNMTAANMAYFARQMLMCKSEDIRFHTAPNTPAMVHELSYTFLDLYDWLDMVNTYINPYSEPVTEGKLDLVYLHNGEICCTTAINGIAYFSIGQGSASESPEETDTQDSEEAEAEENVPEETVPPFLQDIGSDNSWFMEM